jgi:hypothetical protein
VGRTVQPVAYPRGIMPTNPELKRLRQVFAKRERARIKERQCSDELALEVWRVRQRGVSARNLAKLLGVGSSTIQGWTRAGQQLAAQRDES